MCVCIGGMLKFLFVCLLFFVCRLPVYVDCIRTRASVEGHGHTYEGTHTHTQTHTHTHTHTHRHARTHARTLKHTHARMHLGNNQTLTHAHANTHTTAGTHSTCSSGHSASVGSASSGLWAANLRAPGPARVRAHVTRRQPHRAPVRACGVRRPRHRAAPGRRRDGCVRRGCAPVAAANLTARIRRSAASRSGRGAHMYCSLVHLPSHAGSAVTFVMYTSLRRAL